jgi:hypothetical protein
MHDASTDALREDAERTRCLSPPDDGKGWAGNETNKAGKGSGQPQGLWPLAIAQRAAARNTIRLAAAMPLQHVSRCRDTRVSRCQAQKMAVVDLDDGVR